MSEPFKYPRHELPQDPWRKLLPLQVCTTCSAYVQDGEVHQASHGEVRLPVDMTEKIRDLIRITALRAETLPPPAWAKLYAEALDEIGKLIGMDDA